MKSSLMILLFYLVTIQLIGQETKDIIYLKNGVIVYGSIVEQIVGESVKVKLKDGSLSTYKLVDIQKFDKESIKENSFNLKNENKFQTIAPEISQNNPKSFFVKVSVGNKLSLDKSFSDIYGNGNSVKLGLYSSGIGLTTGYTTFSGKGEFTGNSFSYIPILFTYKMLNFKTNGFHFIIDSEIGGYLTKTKGSVYGVSVNSSDFYFGLNIGATLAYKINERFIPNIAIDSDIINIFSKSSTTLYGAHLGLIYKI